MNLFVYILLCLLNRFLIIKLLVKKLIITNAGIAPSGTTGLRKPPGSLLPACLYLCLHQCGLLKHVTCLKKMQFPKWDSAFSLWMRRESSRNAITLVCFWKSKTIHMLQLEGASSMQLLSEQGAIARPPLSSGLKSAFRHERREDSLELANRTTDLLPQE